MRVLCLLVLICAEASETRASAPSATVESPRELTVATELERKGDLKGAERVLLNFIDVAEAAGADGVLSAALNNLAVLYMGMERVADAERYFKRAMRVMASIEGEAASRALARTKLQLASLYIESGRVRDVAKLDIQAAIDALRTPPEQARGRSILAALAMGRNDLTTAEQMSLGVLSFWQSNNKEHEADAEIATALNNLGIIAFRQGRLDTAISRLNQSLTAWRGLLGPDNPTLAKAMSNLATVCTHAKRYEEAVQWQQEALGVSQRAFGNAHPLTVALQTGYAETLKKAGRKAEATEVGRAASEARKSLRSPSTADYTIDIRDYR
jgi:tetratricopeptide (TPR) repeat protein